MNIDNLDGIIEDWTSRARIDAPHKLRDEIRAEILKLGFALVEATAEVIYLRRYGKDGALWSANESKDVWRDLARADLMAPK